MGTSPHVGQAPGNFMFLNNFSNAGWDSLVEFEAAHKEDIVLIYINITI